MESNEGYLTFVTNHYNSVWKNDPTLFYWKKGPVNQLPQSFHILKYAPTVSRKMWTYATCGMSAGIDQSPLELHIFAPQENDNIGELLTAVAHYHRTGSILGLDHTVNFGQPWWPKSNCEYGLISLPYLDGESLEWGKYDKINTRFLWLVPITAAEVLYKKKNGIEALEKVFESLSFDYLNPYRTSVI